ncbi:hypothetical protein [Methanohalophilus sp.]
MRKIGLLLMMLMLSVSFAGATANHEDGYTIVPVKSDSSITPRWVSDTITQGETNWHSKSVSSYTPSLHIDLNWGDTSDSFLLLEKEPATEDPFPFEQLLVMRISVIIVCCVLISVPRMPLP